MFQRYKLLAATALLSSALTACSGETATTEPSAPIIEQAGEAAVSSEVESIQAAALAGKAKADAAAKEAAIKAEARAAAEREAKEAMERAEAEAKAAKDAMERAEAQARDAKNAADAKAAKEAMARAEEQSRLAQEQQAAIEAQAARDAQAALEAEAARQAEAERQAQAVKDAAAQTVTTPPATTTPEPIIEANPNAPYNAFLSKYVRPVNGINLVAYDKVTPTDRAQLRAYIETLSAMDIEALPRDAEMATWFNLYNAKTIELILENYPTKSIRKISNPWKRDRLVVNGKKMSLDDIEHGTVRKKYNEPRVHYAFNCASIGCPNVKSSAWEAATLDADLTKASRDFVASERGVSIQGNKIIVSSIFKWYKKDFGGNEASILAHLRQYAVGPKKAALDAADNINKYDYDWDLNIQ